MSDAWARANAIFGVNEAPETYTTVDASKGADTMTTPAIYNLMSDYARYGLTAADAAAIVQKRIPDRAGYRPERIVLHIQAGHTAGSLKYWVGVPASSTVMIQHDGSILKIIPEQHGPWTNGDVKNPSVRGRAAADSGGGDPNRITLSIEFEAADGADITPAQVESGVWQCRDWMARYPWLTVDDVLGHFDINSVDRPNDPGPVYDVIVGRLSTDPATPAYTTPAAIPFAPGDVGWYDLNGRPVYAITAEVQAKRDNVVRRAWAGVDAPKAGPNLQNGEKVTAIGSFAIPRTNAKGKVTQERWVIFEDKSRARGSGLTPLLPIKP